MDVAIDSPDSSRDAITVTQTKPMTQQEIDEFTEAIPKSGESLIAESPVALTHVLN